MPKLRERCYFTHKTSLFISFKPLKNKINILIGYDVQIANIEKATIATTVVDFLRLVQHKQASNSTEKVMIIIGLMSFVNIISRCMYSTIMKIICERCQVNKRSGYVKNALMMFSIQADNFLD